MNKQPNVQVGILSEKQIEFVFPEQYMVRGKKLCGKEVCDKETYDKEACDKEVCGKEVCGEQKAVYQEGRILWNGELYNELLFEPIDEKAAFELKEVTIGINFHWERKENQRFPGALKIIVDKEKLIAINIVPVEQYLTSVISSEMSATASLELLKAHAVISRSWLLDKIVSKELSPQEKKSREEVHENDTLIRWYDHESHTLFDVCADDHCQRYQGITRASTEIVRRAVLTTQGEVLTFDGKICDARFSKCCGGAFEEFQNCWENVSHPYLRKQRDSQTDTVLPDLRIEEEAEKWIRTSPEAFCNTTESSILSQVLNGYDQETTDFYRWQVKYTQQELSTLIRERSGIDFGEIIDLVPVERGTSGRLIRLKIVGSKRTMILGKELEIRRTLSPSHLYSSAFVIDKKGKNSPFPERFILTGAGWGHGVGLCQIGAAVMGERGYTYEKILLHYYKGANIEKRY